LEDTPVDFKLGHYRFVKMADRVHPKKGASLELPFPEEEG
jgi:hypothetical protein